MTLWAPNINIFRDPRWGRGQETPGEDPMMVGKYGVSYVRGLQGDSFEGGKLQDGHLQASACCKHFIAQDVDNWNNINRFTFDAHVLKQDLADSYEPPFKGCVEQGKSQQYIVSDCDAVSIMHNEQGFSKEPDDAVVASLKAGNSSIFCFYYFAVKRTIKKINILLVCEIED
ncbi:hypothetical protein RND71_039620 [Anisodus tanguticus]|uniref:Glycoside hydrolase family 3 N-terminal domain-containing protein n=1 Tax=Anisodus tanguticus TaxID=243964 RepID=A0AAE1QXS4_9SOLA|nr:hypothetical protein RND71_039620 [Anisodus tanguticus]